MESTKFQKTLLHAVVCTMACDGEIHESELKEIREMFNQTELFKDLEYSIEIEAATRMVVEDFRGFLSNLLISLEEVSNSAKQLRILEIMLRLIHADDRVDENEITLLNLAKQTMNIRDEIFLRRFGNVDGIAHGDNKENVDTAVDRIIADFSSAEFEQSLNIQLEGDQ